MNADYGAHDIALSQDWAEKAFGVAGQSLPFSFALAGQPASTFIDAWARSGDEEVRADGSRRMLLVLRDPASGLKARAEAMIYADTAGVDWTLSFTNTGSTDAPLLEQVRAVDTVLPASAADTVTLHRLKGSFNDADDWLPFEDDVEPGTEIEFAPVAGRSSNGESPFLNVALASGGVIVAVGWSGQWCACVQRDAEGWVRIEAGLEHLSVSLKPGETIRTPRILLLHWGGQDVSRAQNLCRRTMLEHIVPKVDGKTITPPIAHLSTSFYEQSAGTEEAICPRYHYDRDERLGFSPKVSRSRQ